MHNISNMRKVANMEERLVPEQELQEKGILIVTGSTLRAEQGDRKLAYQIMHCIQERLYGCDACHTVVVSDLWYLNSEPLQKLPTISIGGPNVNALAAHLYKQLPNTLIIDRTLVIQMDPNLQDLRASVWGASHCFTVDAVDLFVKRGYLDRFIDAAVAHLS